MFAFRLCLFSHSVEKFKIIVLCSELYKDLHIVDSAHIRRPISFTNYVVLFTGTQVTEETIYT